MPSSVSDFPDAAALAALRAWYAGMSTRDAVHRYLSTDLANGRSARGAIGAIRRALMAAAARAQRPDLVRQLNHPVAERLEHAKAVAAAIETLRYAAAPMPQLADAVEQWLSPRTARVLQAQGLTSLADLAVRMPLRRQWWTLLPGLGRASAKRIEAFFAAHPSLVTRLAHIPTTGSTRGVVPWENLRLPHEVDGSEGTFRAPLGTSTLDANNDYDAVQAWLSFHESAATQRTYRKEAERLMLWAIIERGRALSSLTTEDALAYRTFLLSPTPRERWVGPLRPRTSPDWRPFAGNLSARSAAHSLSILGGLFRWLIAQRYVLANPFAGVKVRGAAHTAALDTTRGFTEGEWSLLRAMADGLEWSYGWKTTAAARLRFLLDIGFATGLRAGELVRLTLGQIQTDERGEHWLRVMGKGQKPGKVALPPMAWEALTHYLLVRGLPISPTLWQRDTPIIGSLDDDTAASISSVRLWAIMKRFFGKVAVEIEAEHPPLAAKLRRASPHWMRHTHATYALAHGAELTTVRDNLRHASVSTTSLYLHTDDVKRAGQMAAAFGRSE